MGGGIMAKHLSKTDLEQLKDIISKLIVIKHLREELESLSNDKDTGFVNTALDKLKEEEQSLKEEFHKLIESLK
jgi:hypothetical protein